MNKKSLLFGSSVLALCISIVISSCIIGEAIKSNSATTSTIGNIENLKVLNKTQVAEYLNMTEEEVESIIEIENYELTNVGSFTGKMFPYFIVDDNLYSYKDEIDVWLQEVTTERRSYNLKDMFH